MRRSKMPRVVHCMLSVYLIIISGFASAQPRADSTIAQRGAAGSDWAVSGGTTLAWRYSSLNQINSGNVKKLVPIWQFETGDYVDGLESTPIVVKGVVYLYTASSNVIALDGATGRLIWEYKYEHPANVVVKKRNFSGVAIGDNMVFLGTRSNYLIALDQKTGKELWKVANGDASDRGGGIACVPLIAGDKVIVGSGGPRGSITAYDIKTGHFAWRFYTIPAKGEKGSETWPDEELLKYGGGNVWTSGSYDPELNLVYWGVGDPRPTFDGGVRGGVNLYSSSVLALEPDTGKLRWYYQEVPNDMWDWDASSEKILIDREVEGRMRKLLVDINKSGFVWVLDRETGELIRIYQFADYINWVKSIDSKGELIGRVEPVVGRPTLICPSNLGAKGWNQAAYSPVTGLVYVPVDEYCNDITLIPPRGGSGGGDEGGGTFDMRPVPGHDTGYSHLDALDPLTGKRKWRYPYKYELMAPILATAGNLVFTGNVEGQYFALDAKTGEKLWSYQTGAFHRGGSVTYSVAGRQIILTPLGGTPSITSVLWPEASTWRDTSAVVAFALPLESK